jgi:dihydropteroate synthase
MGILNLTTDSFYDGGKYNSLDKALYHTESMLKEGAFFIDIGAASSKPGSELITPENEKKKLIRFRSLNRSISRSLFFN